MLRPSAESFDDERPGSLVQISQESPQHRHSIGRPRYFDVWEMDSMVSTRPPRPTEQQLTMVPATFKTPRGWMALSTYPSARRSRHCGLRRRAKELTTATPRARVAIELAVPTLESR